MPTITGRNKKNSRFRLDKEKVCISEKAIIDRIRDGENFYTRNEDKTYTRVTVTNDGHLRSIPNNTTVDNLDNLPDFCLD